MVQLALLQVPGQQSVAGTVIIHQQIKREILGKELGVVLQALLIERVQNGVTGAVRRRTSALPHLLAIADGLAAKGRGAGKGASSGKGICGHPVRTGHEFARQQLRPRSARLIYVNLAGNAGG